MNPPAIAPIPLGSDQRPFWSVMIPVYRPDPKYLRQALESVLHQTPGSEKMQIEVVDDCSPEMDVPALVKGIAGDKVKVSRTPENLGLAGCWNACIERAQGQWVHILHQDDLVLPEFYMCFELLIRKTPQIEAAFARHIFSDDEGHWESISPLEQRVSDELSGFGSLIATWQRIQCAAVVVKRSAYERLGGFRNDLPYVLDWEMWCRIAASARWGYVPQLGAIYRRHQKSETKRLSDSGELLNDLLVGGRIARSHFPQELRIQTEPAFQCIFVKWAFESAQQAYVNKHFNEAREILRQFHSEAIKSKYRRAWIWLRFRVCLKPWRLRFAGKIRGSQKMLKNYT